MRKFTHIAILVAAAPFMLVGAIGRFVYDAILAGADVFDAVMDDLIKWIDR